MQLVGNQEAAGGGAGGVEAVLDTMLSAAVDYVLGTQDLLKAIFQHLDIKEVCTAASVCSIWYQVGSVALCDVLGESFRLIVQQWPGQLPGCRQQVHGVSCA